MATAEIQTPETDPLDWLRAGNDAKAIGVDRESEVIRGIIVAQEGQFKSEGRGSFDLDALAVIGDKINASPNGLKSRLAHPDESNDGIGKFLGRVKNARLDEIGTRESEGELKTDRIGVVRADLHIDTSSHETPSGDLGGYVMALAESDSAALATSLVLQADKEFSVDDNGRPKLDEGGNEIPPAWRPTHVHALDLVDTGDACDELLSAGIDVDRLPNSVVHRAGEMLDKQFAGKDREFVQSHLTAWMDRYLTRRYGEESVSGSMRATSGFVTVLSNGTEEVPGTPPDAPEADAYDPATDPAACRRRAEVADNQAFVDARDGG